jgi:hypothetical protein
MLTSGNTFGCCIPGFRNSSNDNARPTELLILPLGGGDRVADVVDVVCESVFVSEALVGAVPLVADASAVGASLVPVGVAWLFGTSALLTAGVVTDVVAEFTGDRGLIGLAGFVGLFIDFLQVSDVVTQGCHVGLPYGSGHIEERVWVMLPV